MQDKTGMDDLSEVLRSWRRAKGLKQGLLADMLGVSQSSVSRWERGLDQPSAVLAARLRSLVFKEAVSEIAVQQAITERLPGFAALVDLDGMRLLATTRAFKAVWSEAVKAEGERFAEHLTELSRELFNDEEFLQSVKRREIALVTGVSNRHVEGFGDNAFRHHWSATYRNIGTRHFVEMVFEPCEPGAELGLRHVLRVDEIG
jgi:transcriptional regulator with XRE-family HTH domain